MNYWIYVCIIIACLPTLIQIILQNLNKKKIQKQHLQREEYLKSLKADDEILTLSGVHGKIVSIKGELVELMIAKNVVIYIERESIMGKTKELLFK